MRGHVGLPLFTTFGSGVLDFCFCSESLDWSSAWRVDLREACFGGVLDVFAVSMRISPVLELLRQCVSFCGSVSGLDPSRISPGFHLSTGSWVYAVYFGRKHILGPQSLCASQFSPRCVYFLPNIIDISARFCCFWTDFRHLMFLRDGSYLVTHLSSACVLLPVPVRHRAVLRRMILQIWRSVRGAGNSFCADAAYVRRSRSHRCFPLLTCPISPFSRLRTDSIFTG